MINLTSDTKNAERLEVWRNNSVLETFAKTNDGLDAAFEYVAEQKQFWEETKEEDIYEVMLYNPVAQAAEEMQEGILYNFG